MLQKRTEAQAFADVAMWEKADRQNSDPTRFCPVQVTGFEALHQRRASQHKLMNKYCEILISIQNTLHQLADERRVAIDVRLRHYKTRQHELQNRVLRLVSQFEQEQLARRLGGLKDPPLSAEESEWVLRIKQLQADLNRPGSGVSRLSELSAALEEHQSLAESELNAVTRASMRVNLPQLEQLLNSQQSGIHKLVELQKRNERELAIARQHNL